MSTKPAFAVWLTGLPASGKSAIARIVTERLVQAGVRVEVLESDEVRRILTPEPTYEVYERDVFYRALAWCGSRLVAQEVSVIFDATANRRVYRDLARTLIPHFLEVAVVCPLEVCQQRDYKGTYKKGTEGVSLTVPGLHEPYEPPLHPELVVETTSMTPEEAATIILVTLRRHQFL